MDYSVAYFCVTFMGQIYSFFFFKYLVVHVNILIFMILLEESDLFLTFQQPIISLFLLACVL